MNFKTSDMDMLHGPLLKKLLLFTLPIALSSMLQQLFNAADTAVVGYFKNADALSAVGTNTEIIALIVTLSSGLSIGANILVANLIGKNRKSEIASAIKTSVVLSVIIGVIGLIFGQFIAKPILQLIHTPNNILQDAVLYLRTYMLGYPFLLLYDFGAAILRARGDSRYPFFALVVSGIANVGLNLFFVVVFRMGVAGVAVATGISNILSAFTVLQRLAKEIRSHQTQSKPRFLLQNAQKILKTGIPSAVQGAVFCFANIFVQATINNFGKTAIAGSTVAMNFEYFTYYIITAFGQTATTFIGQNYAASRKERCKKIFWLCLLLSTVCSFVPIFIIVLFRNSFSALFTPDKTVIEYASVRILCILLFEPLCSLYEIPSGALRGSGHALRPAAGSILGTCVFRIVWILTVFRTNPTLPMLYYAFPLSWLATILFVNSGFLITYRTEKRKYKSN